MRFNLSARTHISSSSIVALLNLTSSIHFVTRQLSNTATILTSLASRNSFPFDLMAKYRVGEKEREIGLDKVKLGYVKIQKKGLTLLANR